MATPALFLQETVKKVFRRVLAGALLLFCGNLLMACDKTADSMPLQQNVAILDYQYHPANSRQYEASVQMGVFDRCLYFTPEASSGNEARLLYVLKDGKMEQVTQLSQDVMAMGDGYVYYSDVNGDAGWGLNCYAIAANKAERLMPMERYVRGNSMDWRTSYLAEDGTYCFYTDDSCYPITGTRVGKPAQGPETYTMGDYSYYVEGRTLMRKRADETPQSLSAYVPDGVKSMIPCQGGLLIHNAYSGNLLYFIEETSGEIVELFSVPCIYAVSAVNVHGKDVYLSFKRFEKEGLFGGYERFPNDTLEGTYRISLEDGSAEKISDEIYDGLFIFDDTGIYACNEDCHIYKLGFDGNVIMTIRK